MRSLLPLYGFMLVVFAAACLYLFKIGLDDYMASQSLGSVAVAPAQGWDSRPYQTVDGETITDIRFDEAAAAGTTTQDILRGLEVAKTGQNHSVATTFFRGDEMVVLGLRFVPHTPRRVTMRERLGYAPPPEPGPPDPTTVIATVFGIPFVEQPREAVTPGVPGFEPVNYRHFSATIGDQKVDDAIEISLLTNSSDAAVVAVMSRLDVLELNSRLPTPDPQVSASDGVFTRDPQPLSDAPPRPTTAYRAAQLMAQGEVFEPPWQDALEQIRAGEIGTWEALHAAYPEIEKMPVAMLDVVDDGSADNAARYRAAVLRNSGQAWNGHEAHILAKISQLGTSQSDLSEYLEGEYDVAPELVALIRRLPVISMPGADLPASETGVGTSRSDGCTIENGVRRCVIGNN